MRSNNGLEQSAHRLRQNLRDFKLPNLEPAFAVPLLKPRVSPTGLMGRMASSLLVAACSVPVMLGCDEEHKLPPIAEVLGYEVETLDWPWCAVELPPVRSDFDVCPMSDIGGRIKPERVCRLAVALKSWMENPPRHRPPGLRLGDRNRIRSIVVCGWGPPSLPGVERDPNAEPIFHIEVNMGVGRRMFWAALDEEASPQMSFGDTHR